MLTLTIEGSDYSAVSEWSDLNLQKFIELSKIECPEELKKLWEKAGDKKEHGELIEKLETRSLVKDFPTFYGKVIDQLTEIPEELTDRITRELREKFYYDYLHQFYVSTLTRIPQIRKGKKIKEYEPELIGEFEHKGIKYIMPKTEVFFGNVIPMPKEKIISFAEASDIEMANIDWAENGLEAMSSVVAIYCRVKDEKYNEDVIRARAKVFETLGMDKVWQVFFCIMRSQRDLKNITHKSILGETSVQARHKRNRDLQTTELEV